MKGIKSKGVRIMLAVFAGFSILVLCGSIRIKVCMAFQKNIELEETERMKESMIIYKEFGLEQFERVKEIYVKEEWWAYLKDDEALRRAFTKSIFCLGAFYQDQLIGFVRCVGDGEHIIMVQDLIVTKEFQGKKIGTTLFQMTWDKYSNVRMFQVNTDIDDERDNRFYQSFGMKPISEGNMISYYR